ncbi:beta-1,6-N-acetylglucosaminyltransferase [uncultured Chryseobacterium sp.]|uniref:beta-1,6-N-acetylglucosaminyltransferase n=1 Tax=uncultured Chryseobacterium sp. TaxID=259322 RepID=UPI0025DB80B2|nr:beta-1,6-N-acetylglucosaminyltransferase [uncultured Chryseobacterium sp.]
MPISYTIPEPQTQPVPSRISRPVKIAYFIMVHHKPQAFKELFRQIYTKDQYYLIHIDRKAKPEVTEEIQLYLIRFPNAYVLESMNIVSGGFSMIQAELNAMEYLLQVSREWDYFINLSGEDYPLRSQKIIRQFLGQQKERNYLFYYDQKFYRPDTLQRIQNHFTELTHKISSLIYKREFMKDVIPYIGGKWMILTRTACLFMTGNKRVMEFEDYYLHTLLPAESFFQTVFMNTEFNEIIINDDKRAVMESETLFSRKQDPDEMIAGLKSKNQLFIRKIDPETDEAVFRYIEESFDQPLPEIDEIERELKKGRHQDN